jgi:hypothetical protein
VAGILGALGAIPIAGSIQVVLGDWQRERAARRESLLTEASGDGEPSVVTPPA